MMAPTSVDMCRSIVTVGDRDLKLLLSASNSLFG